MSASRSQRVGIWIIAIVMAAGTIGSFFVIILENDNAKIDQADSQKQQDAYNKIVADYQAKVNAQATELSAKYYPEFSPYASQVGSFNADDVKSFGKQDLKVGDGEELKTGTSYSAYYIGWNPSGKIFDQSIDGTKLKAPIPGSGLIKGWTDGVIGMKIGGVRLLTLPADQAYGDKGNGDLIPPHTPLKFIVMAIATPPTIPVPDLSSFQR
jgi:FKBP-type peptidyl-prolyl cis-trans isomerase